MVELAVVLFIVITFSLKNTARLFLDSRVSRWSSLSLRLLIRTKEMLASFNLRSLLTDSIVTPDMHVLIVSPGNADDIQIAVGVKVFELGA